jgi:hypothetical protein
MIDSACLPTYVYDIPAELGYLFKAWLSSEFWWTIQIYQEQCRITLYNQENSSRDCFTPAKQVLVDNGWIKQPARGYQVWVQPDQKMLLECDGEGLDLRICHTTRSFQAELASAKAFYDG